MERAQPRAPLSITRAGILGTIIVLVVALVCVRLGFWQLSRLRQRQARNAALEQRTRATPIPFSQITDTSGITFTRVLVEGTYDHDHTIVLANRSLRGVPGVYVLTPVRSPSGNSAVIVNRGWSPAADGATINLDSLRSPATIRLEGIALPFPGYPNRTAAADSFRPLHFQIDPESVQRELGYRILPILVQALPDGSPPGFPARLRPPPADNGPHLGYAIQWFSFAIIAIGGWLALVMKRADKQKREN